MKNLPSGLSNLKSKGEKLDVDKLVLALVNFSNLGDIAKNDAVKKDVNNAKIKDIEDRIPAITNLATKTTLNAKINEVKGEIPIITNLATNAGLTAFGNKIYNVSNLIKKHKIKLKRILLIMVILNILLHKNLRR